MGDVLRAWKDSPTLGGWKIATTRARRRWRARSRGLLAPGAMATCCERGRTRLLWAVLRLAQVAQGEQAVARVFDIQFIIGPMAVKAAFGGPEAVDKIECQ